MSIEKKSSSKLLLSIAVSIIVIFLCYFKYAIIQNCFNNLITFLFQNNNVNPSSGHIFFLGVSYFSFKFIHFLVECYNKKIKGINFIIFLNYILFFPSFFSGPINRYNSFAECITKQEKKKWEDIVEGCKRIINGLFKKIVLSEIIYKYTIVALHHDKLSMVQIAGATYIYMWYVYFNFSGYTDMAIGCGRLVGIDLPENFNYPFFQRNIKLFWANWHMSLTAWLTDYVYWPLARKFRNIPYLKKKPVTISNICIIATFLICGIWHGDSINYLLWGLYHGMGLAFLNAYTHLLKKYSSQAFRKFIDQSHLAYGISMFITIQFVAFGFLIFAFDIQQLKSFLV